MSSTTAKAFYDPQVGETSNYITPQDAKDAIDVIYADMAAADNTKVNKSGDTMTGLLTLSGAPTNTGHAATKDYVDTQDGLLVPKAGGTMTGALVLHANPAVALGAATKQYVDLKADIASPTFTGTPAAPTAAVGTNTTQVATTAFVNSEIANDALLKSGGTLTGDLTLSGNPTNALHAAPKQYVDNNFAAYTNWTDTTPTITQTATITKTVNYSKYCRIGNIVHFIGNYTLTSAGTAAGIIEVALPVACAYSANAYFAMGSGLFWDNGTGVYNLVPVVKSGAASVLQFRTVGQTSSSVNLFGSSVTIANTDLLSFNIMYPV